MSADEVLCRRVPARDLRVGSLVVADGQWMRVVSVTPRGAVSKDLREIHMRLRSGNVVSMLRHESIRLLVAVPAIYVPETETDPWGYPRTPDSVNWAYARAEGEPFP